MPRAVRLRCAPAARHPARLLAIAIAIAVAVVLGLATAVAIVAVAGANTARAATAWPPHVFAPYVDTGLSNTTLTTVAADDGTKFFTLAFVNGSGCQWSLPQSGWQSQVSALQAEGGDVSVSFGGYTVDTDATDLGAQCSSASAMAEQVESVVASFNVTHLDFDIESNEQTDTADLALTAQALDLVRSWASGQGINLTISYTIPTLPTGLTSEGEGVLATALANGFTPNIVNIMTMDYGTSGTEMGTAADQALDAAAGQLESIYGISESAAYAMLGNTPMIGQNDTPGEIFTLADAATVKSYAAQRGIGWLSFWAEGRDNGGCPGDTSASSTCSGLTQNSGAFTQAFQAFTSGSSGGTPTPDADADAHPHADPHVRLVRDRLGQQRRLRLRQRGLLRRRRLDRRPVELRRSPGRRLRRLDQRRGLLTDSVLRGRCARPLSPRGDVPPSPRGVTRVRSDKFEFPERPVTDSGPATDFPAASGPRPRSRWSGRSVSRPRRWRRARRPGHRPLRDRRCAPARAGRAGPGRPRGRQCGAARARRHRA